MVEILEAEMKYLSLFSGIGGFEHGIYNAFRKFNKRPHCIGFSEIDKYAKSIYLQRFPNHKEYGNAKNINTKELPDFDLLAGGFPCQTFSIAGKRAGFNDSRGTLFFGIARILKDKRPRYFLLENVKGLLSHDKGKTFQIILGILSDLGYRVEWQVLNSRYFGVPQNRPRVFFVGCLRNKSGRQIFPIGKSDQLSQETKGRERKTQSRICSTIDSRYGALRSSGETYIGTLRSYKSGRGFREMKSGLCPTIPARAREDGTGQPVIYQRPHGYNKGGVKKLPCLRSSSMEQNDFLLHNAVLRRLTPIECERLQGFPDDWSKYGKDGEIISDTQRYKCLGNAVTTYVVAEIINALFK